MAIIQSNKASSKLVPFAGPWHKQKNKRCVWIVTKQGSMHSHAFDEVAIALQGAFTELGGSLPIVRGFDKFGERSPIIYGANILPKEIIPHLPADSIIMNLEQVADESIWMNPQYLEILKHFPVLDYSARNRSLLAEKGIEHAGLLEIGYSPCLTRIPPATEKDIDVLFYGSINQRRADMITALRETGLRVAHLFNAYGAERDAVIARSKIVLNIHHFSSNIFEIVRVSYLLANGVCVVSEGNPEDPDIAPFTGGLAVVPYEGIVERCLQLASDKASRQALSERGFQIMRSRSQADMLRLITHREDNTTGSLRSGSVLSA